MGAARAADLAFHGALDEAEAVLGRDRSPEARWIRAYVAAARGRFFDSLDLARPLTARAPRAVRVAASITAGSALRQLGHHRTARHYDRIASKAARTGAERAHATIGLAADAIGLGQVAVCARLLADAAAIAPTADWRVNVRLDWVRTEHAVATGRPRSAIPARRALRRARAEHAIRHAAKSHLLLGGAHVEYGNAHARERALNAALHAARACGAEAIVEVARRLLERGRDRVAG